MDINNLLAAIPNIVKTNSVHNNHNTTLTNKNNNNNPTTPQTPIKPIGESVKATDLPTSTLALGNEKSKDVNKSAEHSTEVPEILYPILEEHGYTITDKIGSGSFSKVKKAHSVKEHQTVAIKLVSKSSAPKDYLEKFLPREIDVVKTLHHDNIIKYYRCIETTRRVYIVMQYAENGSLLEKIRLLGQLDESEARHIYKQLLSALEFCHEQGVVHRDIKCENLLFDNKNVLKLIDFGFARKFQAPCELSRTYCGSYAYACPHILRAIPYDPKFADIWASGVVLYAMVFGRLPFDDSSFSKLIKQVSNKLNFSTKGSKIVSEQCKSIINLIIDRTGNRTISEVKKHSWMNEPTARLTI